MNRELFYEIILFAEERGYKGHLKMLPIMPDNPTSYDDLAKRIFWQRRYEIIFNRDFGKAIWGEGYCVCKCCGGKYTEKDFDNEELWVRKEQGQTIVDYVMCIYDRDYDLHFLSIDDEKTEKGWQYHLHMMVLAKDPFKYLEQEYKRIK